MEKYNGEINVYKIINDLSKLQLKIKKFELILEYKFNKLHNDQKIKSKNSLINNYNKYLKLLYLKEFLIKFLSLKIEKESILI